jgi:hypothetical protein
VRRIHRRDLNRVWEFLKLVFRDVIRETVEYQRPRLKKHFFEIATSRKLSASRGPCALPENVSEGDTPPIFRQ